MNRTYTLYDQSLSVLERLTTHVITSAAQYTEGVPASELSYDTGSWMMATYYYSSCYANWDGYAITHDPVFVAYPAQRPGDVSNLINGLMNASWAVAAIGVVAIGAVCVRTNRLRKSV